MLSGMSATARVAYFSLWLAVLGCDEGASHDSAGAGSSGGASSVAGGPSVDGSGGSAGTPPASGSGGNVAGTSGSGGSGSGGVAGSGRDRWANPGTGGSGDGFSLLFRDDFDGLDTGRWQLMTHSWAGNLADSPTVRSASAAAS